MGAPLYRRVILKLSGEALAGKKGFGIDRNVLDLIVEQIVEIKRMDLQIGVVVGGGNIWRGRNSENMDRTSADHMGMLATVINSLALQDALENQNIPTRVQTAISMQQIAEPYIRRRAIRHLEKGRVVIFACGTGNPFFSTDTAAALRAAEIEADVILLAKNVDALYDDDPKTNPSAKKIEKISYTEILARGLGIMDASAVSLCKENKIPVIIFGLQEHQNIKAAVLGNKYGTIIGEE